MQREFPTCEGVCVAEFYVLFIILNIHHIIADIETQGFCLIMNRYNGLPFFESKVYVVSLGGFVRHFAWSPIGAKQGGKGIERDQ